MEDLPLEILAAIADEVHEYRHLGAMMLVSHRFRDGVLLSRRWRIANEVLPYVPNVDDRRHILRSRKQTIEFVTKYRTDSVHLVRHLLRLTRDEALFSLLVACQHGRMELVRYLVETLDIGPWNRVPDNLYSRSVRSFASHWLRSNSR
eukprot:TRINITY_DN6924_c0_g1_i1.p1 TRINITY_DN6924_c0_g1~~TRINITY_DN6924_c0_g1_i1.p1  ORF type:complete len:148 (-),score=1.81 TRINITY_DN6924_c0_g1_i1:110-553(-)